MNFSKNHARFTIQHTPFWTCFGFSDGTFYQLRSDMVIGYFLWSRSKGEDIFVLAMHCGIQLGYHGTVLESFQLFQLIQHIKPFKPIKQFQHVNLAISVT